MSMTRVEILRWLQTGTIEMQGHLPWSSNYTFLVRVCREDEELLAVYKPRQGERPLWDFPRGSLHQRELAAFIVSEALGWNLVPPTVRRNGPHGVGSVQLFIEHDPDIHYFTIEGEKAFRRQLQQIVLLDFLANNADRKGGHVLLEPGSEGNGPGRLWAIDHGICFHSEYKLRTVIWEFAGEAIPAELLTDLIKFKERISIEGDQIITQLQTALSRAEIAAMQKRLDRIIRNGQFWRPGPGRHYPWPPV